MVRTDPTTSVKCPLALMSVVGSRKCNQTVKIVDILTGLKVSDLAE